MAKWYAKSGPAQRALAAFRLVLLGGLAAVLLFAMLTVGYYTDWLWFQSLGYASVYTTALASQLVIFLVAALGFFTLLTANVLIARRLARRFRRRATYPDVGLWAYVAHMTERLGERTPYVKSLNAAVLAAGAFFAIVLGVAAAGNWLTVLRYVHARPFGVTDPLFGQDVSFYVFVLPFYRFVHGWLVSALLLVGVATLAVYVIALVYEQHYEVERLVYEAGPAVRAHLLLLGAAFLLLLAAHHLLDLYGLVHSQRGVTYGAGYTDVHAQLPAQWALAALALVAAALSVATIFTPSYRPLFLGLGGWTVGALVLGITYPAAVQSFEVRPNELARETPYIEANIRATLQAYGLTQVEEQSFPAEEAVTRAAVESSPQTIENIRLWDHRPLLDTYKQVQRIRPYYDFSDVDIDRYTINGRYRQVMISPRELDPSRLPAQAHTWVNRKLVYTHGYGVAMSAVNAVVEEGLPEFFIRDVPPVSILPLGRPEIYYWESDSAQDYVVVRTAATEFDYPVGDDNAYTRYQGHGGVELSSPWRRLAYAWLFHDLNLLLNTDLRPDSLLLYRRRVSERVNTIAPFLWLDKDPYIVVADGRLVWIVDAYTMTNRYPYSQPQPPEPRRPRRPAFNYVRNSVKITVDAYEGTTTFYVADPTDPLIQTYQAIFPDLFRPLSQMPASLRAHLRYPEDLFRWQATMYLTYHMQNPAVFYNREDLWGIPLELFDEHAQPIDPYYTIMRLPGEPREEFLLMLPLVPANSQNLIAWLAARCDEPHYGKLLVYKYPKDKVIYGPMQVEARIDQDPAIASQFALWKQSGSRVIRGNLLVIPVGNSNLYVEPVYLQASQGRLPELKRVIVATGNRIAMEPTLEAALARLFPGVAGLPADTAPAPSAPGPPTALPPDAAAIARSAREHYTRAQEALRAGDWSRYGEELRALGEDLERLVQLTP
jgi:uncharacterized membrane protein (UPF0182 family)